MLPYTITLIALLGSLLGPLTFTLAADPVYTPATLTDAAGNSADSDAVITWASLPVGLAYAAGSPSRISEGLAPYYNMVHGFIDFVFLKGIPLDIVQKAIDGNLGDIPSNYSEYTSYVVGWAICLVLGFLFMLIFPIVACCFCCCRCCCNKCGGKKDQSDKEAKSKTCHKHTYTVVLACVLAFLVTGAACIYVNNSNTSAALNSISTETKNNVADLRSYVNNTVEQVNHIVVNNFDFLKNALFRDLDNVAYLVGLPIRTNIESQTGIRTTLTNAYTLNADINTADTALADVETKIIDLDASLTTLDTALSDWKDDLDAVFSTCGVSCTGQPSYTVSTGVDSAMLPDLSATRSSMNAFTATNLTVKIIDAEAELDSIPDRVATDSLSTRNSLKTTIGDLSDEIDPVVKEVNNIQDLIYGANATLDLDKVTDQVEDFGDVLKTYDTYRWQGGLGLACIVLFVTVLATLGLVAGVLGSCSSVPPEKRGFVSNCGGILLMASVGFIFIFSTLLMLLTTLTFMLGAPMHAWVCKPISDLDTMDQIWDIYNDDKVGAGNYYLGDVIHNNQSIPLTLTGILRDCDAGKSAMTAFKLDSRFDLNDLLNYSKTLDVQGELDAVSVDFSGVTVYPASLQTQLDDATTALDVDFTAFYAELNNNPTDIDLNTLADELDTYADSLMGPAAASKASIKSSADDLRDIDTNEKADTVAKVAALNTSVAALDAAVGGIPSKITALDSGLTTTDTYITNNASAVVTSFLTTYANRLLGIVDSFKTFTIDAIQTQMGSCSPIWNFYNTMLVYTFCYNIMDTFNGFWFSLGWCVFFFMLGSIMSVKLARHFRRMDKSNKVAPGPGNTSIYGNNGPVVDALDAPDNRKFNRDQFSRGDFVHTDVESGMAPASTTNTLGDRGVTMSSVYVDSHLPAESPGADTPSKLQLYGKPHLEGTMEEQEEEVVKSGSPGSATVNIDVRNDTMEIDDDKEEEIIDNDASVDEGEGIMQSPDQKYDVNEQSNETERQNSSNDKKPNGVSSTEVLESEENATRDDSSTFHDDNITSIGGMVADDTDVESNQPRAFPSEKNKIEENDHPDANQAENTWSPVHQELASEDVAHDNEIPSKDQSENESSEARPSSQRANSEHSENPDGDGFTSNVGNSSIIQIKSRDENDVATNNGNKLPPIRNKPVQDIVNVQN